MRFLRTAFIPALAAVLVATTPAAAADDPGFGKQWGMRIVGAEAAWAIGTGYGMTIAVVDTGVDADHEDLRGRVLPGRNFVTNNAPALDDNGHGTHVAGIAAAQSNNRLGVVGVAPDARILPVKVLRGDGKGDLGDVPPGIRWAADQGAQVINVSLGVGLDIPGERIAATGPALRGAVEYAWDKGSVVVVSAGNDETATSLFAADHAIVVTATDNADRKAPYATRAGRAMWGIAAPGGSGATEAHRSEENVLSTYWVAGAHDKYAYAAGTSMAAPHVAGAVAVLRERGLDAQQAVDRLLATARDLGEPGKDDTFGAGRLDLARAVAGLPASPNRPSAAPRATTTTTTPTRGGRPSPGPTAPAPGARPGDAGPVGPGAGGGPVDVAPFDANGPAPGGVGEDAGEPRGGGDTGGRDGSGGNGDRRPWAAAAVAGGLLAAAIGAIVRARRA